MAITCFIARSAENTVGAALSGMALGGRLECSANTTQIATKKNAMVSRSIAWRFIEQSFAAERLPADSTLGQRLVVEDRFQRKICIEMIGSQPVAIEER
jgi:hypothetical protein